MKFLRTALFLFAFLTVSNFSVFACTCTDYNVPGCKRYQDADAVFVGKIKNITSAMGDKEADVTLSGVNSISSFQSGLIWVHFDLDKAIKGVAGKQVKALTYQGTSCDLEVKKGQRWVIFANKDASNGQLSFGACGGNYRVDLNDEVIDQLSDMALGKAPTVVRGSLTRGGYAEIAGAKVTIAGNGFERNGITDNDGSYTFEVPPAVYKVRVQVPFSAMALRRSEREVLESPTETATTFEYEASPTSGACDYQAFDLYEIDLKATAKVSGRLVQNEGRFFPKIFPELCRLMPTEKETMGKCKSIYELSMDGNFEIGGLREGQYVLVAGEPDYPDSSGPFMRHFYPGTRDFSKAKIIQLEQGEQKEGIVYFLPPVIPFREIKGQVFRRDGKPAALARGEIDDFYMAAYNYSTGKEPKLLFMHEFLLSWGPGVEEKSAEMVDISDDGSFKVTLFEGYSYILSVETNPWGEKGLCGMLKIDLTEALKGPLRIELTEKGSCDEAKFAKQLERKNAKQ